MLADCHRDAMSVVSVIPSLLPSRASDVCHSLSQLCFTLLAVCNTFYVLFDTLLNADFIAGIIEQPCALAVAIWIHSSCVMSKLHCRSQTAVIIPFGADPAAEAEAGSAPAKHSRPWQTEQGMSTATSSSCSRQRRCAPCPSTLLQ